MNSSEGIMTGWLNQSWLIFVCFCCCCCCCSGVNSQSFPFNPALNPFPDSATAPPLTRTELAIASRSPWTSPPSNAVKLQALDRRFRFRNYFTYVVYRWPNNRIPYSMDYRFTSEERVIIAQAFQHIEENSCVTFSAKTGSDQDFVHLYLGEHMGCFADDHYQAGKGQHIVHLNRPICMKV